MKKLLKLSIIASLIISFNSCSSDDSNKQSQDYTITLETECGDRDTRTKYCLTEEELKRVTDNLTGSNPCPYVTITDINGNRQSGFFRSGGTGNCDNL